MQVGADLSPQCESYVTFHYSTCNLNITSIRKRVKGLIRLINILEHHIRALKEYRKRLMQKNMAV